MADSWLIADGR